MKSKRTQQPGIAIDMGERSLFAVVSNIPEERPMLIRNTLERSRIKNIRNIAKKPSPKLDKELAFLNNYILSRCQFLVNYCNEKGIRTLALGNRSVKNPYKVRYKSLRDNPYLNITLHLVNALRFLCSLAGIEVKLADESFTSQIDALALESIEYNGTKRFRRKSRPGHLRGKQYMSSSGNLLDRDINAAINIGRIIFGDHFADTILENKLWKEPVIPVFPEKQDQQRIPVKIATEISFRNSRLLFPQEREDLFSNEYHLIN